MGWPEIKSRNQIKKTMDEVKDLEAVEAPAEVPAEAPAEEAA